VVVFYFLLGRLCSFPVAMALRSRTVRNSRTSSKRTYPDLASMVPRHREKSIPVNRRGSCGFGVYRVSCNPAHICRSFPDNRSRIARFNRDRFCRRKRIRDCKSVALDIGTRRQAGNQTLQSLAASDSGAPRIYACGRPKEPRPYMTCHPPCLFPKPAIELG
jgi:hypothetical protein